MVGKIERLKNEIIRGSRRLAYENNEINHANGNHGQR
jgi:hypothetical protein